MNGWRNIIGTSPRVSSYSASLWRDWRGQLYLSRPRCGLLQGLTQPWPGLCPFCIGKTWSQVVGRDQAVRRRDLAPELSGVTPPRVIDGRVLRPGPKHLSKREGEGENDRLPLAVYAAITGGLPSRGEISPQECRSRPTSAAALVAGVSAFFNEQMSRNAPWRSVAGEAGLKRNFELSSNRLSSASQKSASVPSGPKMVIEAAPV